MATKNLEKFTFRGKGYIPVEVVDTFEVEAESYEDAVKKIRDNDYQFDGIGERVKRHVIEDDERNDTDGYYAIENYEGENID